jgi:hypothetical protein
MEFRRDMLLGIGAMLTLLLLVCFGAVGLFGRMSPAIGRIIHDNDASLEATEEMLRVVALAQDRPGETLLRKRFDTMLDRLRNNVTEQGEDAEIAVLTERGQRALDGDAAARMATIEALERLAQINRDAIHRAHAEVVRLGSAGAWSVAILGLVGFIAGLIVLRRVDSRILQPLAEVHATLTATKQGDARRRIHVPSVSSEVMFIMHSVNDLLDHAMTLSRAPSHVRPPTEAAALRAVLLQMLDDRAEPCAVVRPDGSIEAANRDVLTMLQGPEGDAAADALREGAMGRIVAPVVDAAKVADGAFVVCTLSPFRALSDADSASSLMPPDGTDK